jgi:hypothetical protein
MDKDEFPQFAKMLDAVYALHGKSLTAEAKALFFRSMASFPLGMVRAAMDGHVRDSQRGQYPPKPADLMAQIEGSAADNGRPGAEEAWAIAVKACDESETVVMNDEIAEACGIAKPIMDLGDEVGARMAFKEVYARLTKAAKGAPKWWPSIGSDPHKRDAAMVEAKRAGLLPAPQVAGLLGAAAVDKGVKANPEGLKRLKEEMARLQLKAEADRVEAEEKRVAERKAVQASKQAIAAVVSQYQGAKA